MAYLILFFLLVCSFFFSGTETAVTAVSKPLLHEQAKRGNKWANHLLDMKKDSGITLGTLLFGNNIVNIAFTALSTGLLVAAFGPQYGVVISTFLVSFVVMIFAEILPKTYAINNALPFALKNTPILYVLVKILRPVVHMLNVMSKFAMRLLPQARMEQSPDEALKSEIRGALEMQAENVLPQEKKMVSSVLDLDEVSVGDIMLHRSKVQSLSVDISMPDLFKFVEKTPYSRIPIYQGRRDNIIGILHTRSVLKMMPLYYQKKIEIDIIDYCVKPWAVLNTVSLLDQLIAFKKKHEHFAIIVNEYGDWQGILTLEDLLEEIVGDISDESDDILVSTFHWQRSANGGYILDGSATLRDINRHFRWNLSDENAATLAGYVMYYLERIPSKGQTFDINGWTFSVVEKKHNQLTQIEVVPPAL